jgi:hypothetical protein
MPPTDPSSPPDDGPLELGHPKGTLAIVVLYALLFALGWLALYWLVFVPRGTPHP